VEGGGPACLPKEERGVWGAYTEKKGNDSFFIGGEEDDTFSQEENNFPPDMGHEIAYLLDLAASRKKRAKK